jgi:hypothetical protein
LCESPTESPTNVIFWPPYFFLIAAAFGTFGADTTTQPFWAVDPWLFVPATATRE